jgi:hypothetical protein
MRVLSSAAALPSAPPHANGKSYAGMSYNRALAEAYGWREDTTQPAQPDEPVTLTLALAHDQRTLAELSAALARTSDPTSPAYGQHVPRSELGARFPPRAGAADAARSWAAGWTVAAAGTGDLLTVTGLTVRDAEALLAVRIVAAVRGSRRILRTFDDLEVPSALAGHVDFVHGLSTWPGLARSPRGVERSAAVGDPEVTPQLIWKLYNITDSGSEGKTGPAQVWAATFACLHYHCSCPHHCTYFRVIRSGRRGVPGAALRSIGPRSLRKEVLAAVAGRTQGLGQRHLQAARAIGTGAALQLQRGVGSGSAVYHRQQPRRADGFLFAAERPRRLQRRPARMGGRSAG